MAKRAGQSSSSSTSLLSSASTTSSPSPKGQTTGASIRKRKKNIFSIFDQNYKWEDKDEILDAIYWYRQILAIVTGLVWGFLGLYGIIGIASFAIVNSIAAFSLANHSGYDFDPEDNFLCVKDGFMTTFATFLVSWTVTYTAFHFSHD